QTPQDLTFLNILTGADVQWLIDAKRAALEDRYERQMREQKIERVIDKLTSYEQMAADLAMAKYENRWEDIKQILEGKDRVEQDRLHSVSMAINIAGRTGETVEQRRKRIEEWVRANWDPTQPEPTYWQYHFSPDGANSFVGTGLQMVGTAMEGIVDFFNGAAAVTAGVEDLIEEGTPQGSARAARIKKAQELAQETYEQWVEEGIISKGWGESLFEADPDNLVARVKAEEIAPDVLWEVYKTEEPEEAQDFLMGFALGDEDLAKHAFFQLLKDSDPEVIDAAIGELDKELSAQEWQLIEQLREPDTAENIRAAIASYGEWIEDNATYLSAIFGEAFKQIEANAYFDLDAILERAREKANVADSPAEYFGLQGTLVGLGIDLALINALDPISWLGGAHLSIAQAKTFTASQVRRFVKSPRGIAQLQDAVMVARSGLRGETATVALLDELDAVGLGDEFYAAAQGRSPILPKG